MAGRWRIVAVFALLAPVAACAQGSGGFDTATVLQIESPSRGAQVSVPFTVELSSKVPLASSGGEDSVQVYYDGLKGPVVDSESFQVTQSDLSTTGPHTIHVSLVNQEGTPIVGDDEVRVTVTGGGGS